MRKGPEAISKEDISHVREIARQVASIVRRVTGDRSFQVLLFGSWAEGTARPRSDVDIAIDGTTPVYPKHLAEIRDACDRMATLFTIDLVDLARTSEQFREGVRRNAEVI